MTSAVPEESSLSSIPLESVPINQQLPYAVYVKVADKLVCVRKEGDVLPPELVKSLLERKIDSAYIPSDKLGSLVSQENVETSKILERSRAALMGLERSVQAQHKMDLSTYKKICEMLSSMVNILHEDLSAANSYIRHYEDPSLYSVSHNYNVAIYATTIGARLKYPIEQLNLLAYAGFFHDLGNLGIPELLMTKASELTAAELKIMREHVQIGTAYLKELGADPLVVQATLQHHERMNGSGYPNGLQGQQIHTFARIIAIADVYDALTSVRPNHAKPFTPAGATQLMRHLKGQFDPQIFSYQEENPKVPQAA